MGPTNIRGVKPTVCGVPEIQELKLSTFVEQVVSRKELDKAEFNGNKNQVLAGCDIDERALKIYAANHTPKVILPKDLNAFINFSIRKLVSQEFALIQ